MTASSRSRKPPAPPRRSTSPGGYYRHVYVDGRTYTHDTRKGVVTCVDWSKDDWECSYYKGDFEALWSIAVDPPTPKLED